MNDWYPAAKRDLTFPGVGPYVAAPMRGVLHTTEGSTAAGALATYARTGSYPHFTVDSNGVYQHCPISKAATALANLAGGVHTNKLGAIQIEIVGFASTQTFSDKLYANLKALMVWIEQEAKIKPQAPEFKAYPGSYGVNNGVRFTYTRWQEFNGWCGHEHVPENLHGDPGAIDIKRLLERTNMGDIISAPLAGNGIFAHPAGGYYIVAVDGGVFAFECPFFGSMAGKPMAGPVIGFALTPSGKGYWLIGSDGGVFSFGDAKFLGRVVVR